MQEFSKGIPEFVTDSNVFFDTFTHRREAALPPRHQCRGLRAALEMMENMKEKEFFQLSIPNDLSKERYISGFAALNLPAPENTSGDWHFINLFYDDEPSANEISFVAGTKSAVNTNHIYGDYGIYDATDVLKSRNLSFSGRPYAANHFRAVIDYLYMRLSLNKRPNKLYGAARDFFDTSAQEEELLSQAEKLRSHLSGEQIEILEAWLYHEQYGNQK